MKLGQRIAGIRKEKGYTQEQLAQKIEVTRQTISRWESELSAPDYQYIQKLCEVFEMTIEEFLEINPKEKSVEIELIDQVSEIQTKQVKTMKKYLLGLVAVMVVGFGLILSQISKMNHRIENLNTQVNIQYPNIPNVPSDPNIMERFETFFESINLKEHTFDLTSTIHFNEVFNNMKVQLQLQQNDQTSIVECTNQGNGVFVSDPYTISSTSRYTIVGLITTDQSTKKEYWYSSMDTDGQDYQPIESYLDSNSHQIVLYSNYDFHFKTAPTTLHTALFVNQKQLVEQIDYPVKAAPKNGSNEEYFIEFDDTTLNKRVKKHNYATLLLAVEFPDLSYTAYFQGNFDRNGSDAYGFAPISKQEYDQFFK